MENNNVRTMNFIGTDDWGDDVYKCAETKILYKDVAMNGFPPELCSCSNDFYGEPVAPIKSNFEIHFNKPKQPTEEEKFSYQLLDRLRQDCEYYLGYGDRCKKHLWAGDEQEQINKMKELYNSFPNDKKPQWLTYEQILQYEKLMLQNK